MNYYALIYHLVDTYLEERGKYRVDHLGMAKDAYEKGHLVMGGAMDSPPDQAWLIFKGENDSQAVAFAVNDPYVKNGLVKEWTVRKWNVVIGNE